jgi:hypothetical protein
MRATAQALFLGTAFAGGSIAGSLGAGAVAATGGLEAMFAVMAALALGGAGIIWLAVGRPMPLRRVVIDAR